jgi:cupin fold WbuC family metalloprotein
MASPATTAADNVVFNTDTIYVMSPGVIADLKRRAERSPLRRARLCLHLNIEDAIQEMVIVACGDSYMPPNRHPAPQTKSYHLMEGALDVYILDDAGMVIRKISLGGPETGLPGIYRLSAPLWTFTVPTSDWVAYHEVLNGPFRKGETIENPPWAPAADDTAAIEVLRKRCRGAA